jgi:hypothetical protein
VMRAISIKSRIMIQTTVDLVQGWRAECATLDQKISCLRNGAEGVYLSLIQKEAAIKDLIEAAAEFRSLIDDFSRFEAFPVAFHKGERYEPEPVVRLRFQTDRRVLSESPCT